MALRDPPLRDFLLQSQMIGMLYGKSLRLHASARNEYGTGAIVNLQSNDAQKLWWIPLFMHVLWSAPLQVRFQAIKQHIACQLEQWNTGASVHKVAKFHDTAEGCRCAIKQLACILGMRGLRLHHRLNREWFHPTKQILWIVQYQHIQTLCSEARFLRRSLWCVFCWWGWWECGPQ